MTTAPKTSLPESFQAAREPRPHMLAVSVETKYIPDGIGYLVGFTVTDNHRGKPENHPLFDAWARAVAETLAAAGDDVFNPDRYTKKVAHATIMNDLQALNKKYPFRIAAARDTAAVQIQSSNPWDPRIDMNFRAEEGFFRINEYADSGKAENRIIRGHGAVAVVPAGTTQFPFEEAVPVYTRPAQKYAFPR